jgi:probable rRNA maturation factor
MIAIDIEVKSKKWQEEKNIAEFIKKTCQKIIPLTDLKNILKKDFELEIAISLVCDSQIKKINSQFRNKNEPTDVLSFLSLDENLIRKIGLEKTVGSTNYLFLGDIVISFETLKKDAILQKKTLRNHLTHLILHAIMHLIGYDHIEPKMAKIMEQKEIEILKKLDIKNPYKIDE